MYLKRLELSGFKSFATHTSFVFDMGLTVVVGPNGSGKSNVSDALRWVFGEQKQSLLRGKKADDVIFAGSDKKPRMGSAEVVAVFDNADRRMPLDAPEVAIARRVDRSGNSTYLINGAQVKLQDVAELVLQSGIGTSRAAVVSQGTVDQLVAGGPQELKLLLDEASGVRIYHLRKEKTLRRLEQTSGNLQRAEDRLKEMEPRVKLLQRQVDKYKQRGEIQNNLRSLQKDWFVWRKNKIIFEISNLKKRTENIRLDETAKLEVLKKLNLERENLLKEEETFDKKWDELRRQESLLGQERAACLDRQTVAKVKLEFLSVGNSTGVGQARELGVQAEEINALIQKSEEQLLNLSEKEISLKTELVSVLSALENSHKSPDFSSISVAREGLESFRSLVLDVGRKIETAQDLFVLKKYWEDLFSGFQGFYERIRGFFFEEAHTQAQEQNLKILDRKNVLEANLLQIRAEMVALEGKKAWQAEEQKKIQEKLLRLQNIDTLDAAGSSANTWQEELKKADLQMAEIESRKKILEQAFFEHSELAKSFRNNLRSIELSISEAQKSLDTVKEFSTKILVEQSRLDTLFSELQNELSSEVDGLTIAEINSPAITTNIQDEQQSENIRKQILRLSMQLSSIGEVDDLTIKEYEESERDYSELKFQVEDLKKSREDLLQVIGELDARIRETFHTSFSAVDEKFQEYFKLLFGGGSAKLVLLEESPLVAEDEGEAQVKTKRAVTGIDIKATPPGKKLVSVQALSGGERALSAIALLCAMIACFPAPIVVLDEADAALDEANTVRFGQILASLSHRTQFVTVTHNRETMAKADVLYGVTMGDDGVSRVLSIKLDQAAQYAK